MVPGVFGVQPETLPCPHRLLKAADVSARLQVDKMHLNRLKVFGKHRMLKVMSSYLVGENALTDSSPTDC